MDQRPGSRDTSDAGAASPQSTKSAALVTVAPSECAALVDPSAALEYLLSHYQITTI